MTVFTVPIGLTEFQRDLIEILLSMHRNTFLKEISPSYITENISILDQKTESDPTGTSSHYPTFSPRQMVYLLDTHIRAVANHPCLLVDHYMPRQFLKMEPKQRLINPSNKFAALQELLFGLSHYKQENGVPLSITLVAHSMKELDLIEGLVLGQDFNLKRLSGTTLYDEKNVYSISPDDSSNLSPSTNTESLSSSSSSTSVIPSLSSNSSLHSVQRRSENNVKSSINPVSSTHNHSNDSNSNADQHSNGGSTMNKYTGYSKDEYHYTKKRKIQTHEDSRNWLFLTTTKHLVHDEDLLRRYNTNLIIAFDPLIDDNMPCLTQHQEIIQAGKEKKKNSDKKIIEKTTIPIIKLLVKDSPDHYIIDRGYVNEPDVEKDYQHIKDSLIHFFINRVQHFSSDWKSGPGSIDFKELINTALSSVLDSSIKDTNLTLNETKPDANHIAYFTPNFTKTYNEEHTPSLPLSNHDLNLKSYQLELMQKTLSRLNEINEKCESNEKILIQKRIDETGRQNETDAKKVSIGANFKSLQELEKEKIDSEKRLERMKTENDKLKFIYNKLNTKVNVLSQLITNLNNPGGISEQIKIYEASCNKLENNYKKRSELCESKTNIEDELRKDYQLVSNDAAAKSLELKNWEKTQKVIQERQQSPQLAELSKSSAKRHRDDLQTHLDQIKATNRFLEDYMNRMTELNLKSPPAKPTTKTSRSGGNHGKGKRSTHDSKVSSSSALATSQSTPSANISPRNALASTRVRSTRSSTPNYT